MLAVELGEIARSLQQEVGVDEILTSMVHAALALVPGVDDASISIVFDRKDVTSRAPSSDLPELVDAIQTEERQGPCLEAAYQERTVRVPNMATDARWPRFAARAHVAGVGSMLAIQLYVQRNNLGALNLYSHRCHAFGDESEQIGLLVASHGSIAFADAQEREHLQAAIATRDLIGQAKGILMERYKLTSQQAFHLLTNVSQTTNTKLHTVADNLVTSGEFIT
ncbi:GAF and ANTAR domain-containing protein [Arthrobacter pigmenti]